MAAFGPHDLGKGLGEGVGLEQAPEVATVEGVAITLVCNRPLGQVACLEGHVCWITGILAHWNGRIVCIKPSVRIDGGILEETVSICKSCIKVSSAFVKVRGLLDILHDFENICHVLLDAFNQLATFVNLEYFAGFFPNFDKIQKFT